jgi:hypothetical protein
MSRVSSENRILRIKAERDLIEELGQVNSSASENFVPMSSLP